MAKIIRRARQAQIELTIMGVDASLNSTGYAYRTGNGQLVTGRIKPGSKRGSTRLWHNLKQWRLLLDAASPDVIVLEGYAMGAKGYVYNIGEWGGVLRLEAWKRGIKVITITPSSLKYMATGSGGAKKPQMMQACSDLFGTTVDQDDEADAFLLREAGIALLRHTGPKAFVDRVLEKHRTAESGIDVEEGSPIRIEVDCNSL